MRSRSGSRAPRRTGTGLRRTGRAGCHVRPARSAAAAGRTCERGSVPGGGRIGARLPAARLARQGRRQLPVRRRYPLAGHGLRLDPARAAREGRTDRLRQGSGGRPQGAGGGGEVQTLSRGSGRQLVDCRPRACGDAAGLRRARGRRERGCTARARYRAGGGRGRAHRDRRGSGRRSRTARLCAGLFRRPGSPRRDRDRQRDGALRRRQAGIVDRRAGG